MADLRTYLSQHEAISEALDGDVARTDELGRYSFEDVSEHIGRVRLKFEELRDLLPGSDVSSPTYDHLIKQQQKFKQQIDQLLDFDPDKLPGNKSPSEHRDAVACQSSAESTPPSSPDRTPLCRRG